MVMETIVQPDMTFFYIVLGMYLLILAVIIVTSVFVYFWLDSKKSRFLRFLTNGECQILKGNIKNQKFTTKTGTWHILKTRPIILNTFFGKRPMYLLRDDKCIPYEFDKTDSINGRLIMSSESLKNFCDHDNMKTILKLSLESFKEKMMFLIIGLVMGIMTGLVIKFLMG
jgi:hypothetical protein